MDSVGCTVLHKKFGEGIVIKMKVTKVTYVTDKLYRKWYKMACC